MSYMNTQLSQFDVVASNDRIVKHQQTVDTPVPGGKEENRMVVYEVSDDGFIKVQKVSEIGWSVTLYDSDGSLDEVLRPMLDTEEEAHEVAKEKVLERGDSE